MGVGLNVEVGVCPQGLEQAHEPNRKAQGDEEEVQPYGSIDSLRIKSSIGGTQNGDSGHCLYPSVRSDSLVTRY